LNPQQKGIVGEIRTLVTQQRGALLQILRFFKHEKTKPDLVFEYDFGTKLAEFLDKMRVLQDKLRRLNYDR
jgi:hypothetical protein